MDIAAWIVTAFLTTLNLILSLIWFLIGGWVSALLQIAVLILVIYGLKYGWRRAPFEIWRRTQSFGRFFWGWIRAREPGEQPALAGHETIREIRVREFGDINLSTLMSLLALLGLAALACT
jgi:hypothetical protein